MRSVREFCPDALRLVILADRCGTRFSPPSEDFQVVTTEELSLPSGEWFHFKYTKLELCTAVKPYAFEFLLHRFGLTNLVYLDPDTRLYGSPAPFLSELERASIVLTPHLTAPLEGAEHPTDLDILRSGTYNLGFLALRRGESSERFLQWWQRRCFDFCVVDLPRGLFVDQKWMDLVPGMFPDVSIMRHPGLNMAYWNAGERVLAQRNGRWEVNGQPLVFFHFSGFQPLDPESFSIHQGRFRLSDLPQVRELALSYRDDVLREGYQTCASWPYAYGAFANSEPIPDAGRRIAYAEEDIRSHVRDPFSDDGFRACVSFWNSHLPGPAGTPTPLSRLAYQIYSSRADLQSAMPNILGDDLPRFLEWLISNRQDGQNLTGLYLAPVWDAWKAARHSGPANNGAAGSSQTDPRKTRDTGLTLSRITTAIYSSRPDLQRWFPDPRGKDAMMFRLWLLTYGRKEHHLPERYLEPLQEEWRAAVAGLASPIKRAQFRSVMFLALRALAFRSAGRFLFIRFSSRLARTRFRWIGSFAAAPPENRAPASATMAVQRRDQPTPLSVFGYLEAETGVGEAARMCSRAAAAVGFNVTRIDVPSLLKGAVSHGVAAPGPVNLFHVNADQTPRVFGAIPPELLRGAVNIGFWNWELEEFPGRFIVAFCSVNEVWTPSAFVQDAIQRKSPVPVMRMPIPVDVKPVAKLSRSEVGAKAGEYLFLFAFDMASVFERKNPLAVIRAFRAACCEGPPSRLILKVANAAAHPDTMRTIREACSGLAVTILENRLPRDRMTALIETADCVVSLHRSEGFGLLLAEAMALAKPVIATGYSGNLEFMNDRVSYLVDYRLVPVPAKCGPYDAGSLWAEPSWERAAEYMRDVLRHPDSACAVGERGRNHVRRLLAPEEIGRRMRDRIEVLSGGTTREAGSSNRSHPLGSGDARRGGLTNAIAWCHPNRPAGIHLGHSS
jgi:glycosyltransferase involved in cell wall biosynthesis